MAINQDAFEMAREKLESTLNIPEYYIDNISDINLEAQALVPCPLHDERTASFKYFSDTESFFCFGCERGGSIIELHYYLMKRDLEGYTKSRAVIDLAKAYSVKIPNIYDESIVDEKKAFKVTRPKLNTDKEYPITWLYSEVEKELKIIKKTDLNMYIDLCGTVDNIKLLGYEEEIKLKQILERIYEEV